MQNACAIISLHYNAGPASATGSEVLVPHKVSYNYDLYLSGQIFAGKVNYYLRNKVGIVTRGDGATERGYNDQYGTDYYENGDESDYYGIVRYARQKGILGVIIEHQFISNPAHAAEFKDLGDNSKVDYIGWADAWAIWEMYSSDTWWSMSSVSVAQKDNDVTLKPVLTGVVTDATFTYSYVGPDGTKVTVASNTTATSSTFTLPASGRYTLYITARSSDGQEVTRQTNYDAKIKESYGWRRAAEGWMYSDDNGTAYVSRWLKDDDGWHYFDARGIAVSGWFTTSMVRFGTLTQLHLITLPLLVRGLFQVSLITLMRLMEWQRIPGSTRLMILGLGRQEMALCTQVGSTCQWQVVLL